MKHHAFHAAMGLLIAAALLPMSVQPASADATGYWRKADQGERPGKFQIFKCGSGGRLLCAKIVWLQDPLDSKGRPLHDVRNENPAMRDRPILGLPIFSGLQPVARNQWKGNIYNPEDGNTYSVTVTQVSRNKINVKGCKAWLLCGERTWIRTSAPKAEPEPEAEEQIEASAEPEAKPAEETAAAEPAKEEDAFAEAQMLTPVVEHGTQPGYRFLNGATVETTPAGLSGENVPSMFVMTKPIEGAAAPTKAVAAAEPAAAPKATPQSIQANAAPAPKPQAAPKQAAPKPQPAAASQAATPAPESEADAVESAETEAETETAEAAAVEGQRMTWRERRQLRRQQRVNQQQQEAQGLLPWLR